MARVSQEIEIRGRDRTQRAFRSVQSRMGRLKDNVFSLQSAFTALAGAAVAREFVRAADQYTNLSARVRNATRETQDFNKVWGEIEGISNRTGASLSATVDIFQRLGFARKELGATNDEMLAFSESVQQLGVISGASTSALENGLTQLSQGLGAGILRAEEFNSILENIPAVANAIAKGMNVSVGELRKMVLEGEVMSKDVLRAIQSQSEDIADQFEEIPDTVGRAGQRLENAWILFIGKLEESTGIAKRLAELLTDAAEVLDDLFAEDTAMDKLFQDLDTLVDKQETLQGQLRRLQSGGFDGFVQGLFADEKELRQELEKVNQAIKDKTKQITDMSAESRKAGAVVGDLGLNIKDTGDEADKAAPKVDGYTDAQIRAAKELEDFADAFQELMPLAGTRFDSLADTLRSVGINAQDARGDVVELSDEFERALAETEQQIRDQRRVWDNLIDGVQNAWVGFFENIFQGKGLDSVKDFLSTVKDLFFRLIAEIAAKWTAAKIFGGSFNIGGLSFGGGGGIGGIGGAGKAISAGASKLFGGGAVEAGTGATASAFPGLATLGPQIGVLAAPFIARELVGGGNIDKMFSKFQGFTGTGALGTQIGGAGNTSFAGGPMSVFAGQFAQSQGVGAFTSEQTGLTAFKTDLESLKGILAGAEQEFESLKKSAASTFKLGEKGAAKVGQAIKDGFITPTEFASMGMIELGEKITHAETGVTSLGEVGVEKLQALQRAVDQGTFRLEALRGETMLNQREIAFLGQQGLTAAQLIQGGFDAAAGGVRALRDESVAAAGEMASAFRGAADAAASVGGVQTFGGDPNSRSENRANRFGGGSPKGGGGK